MKLSVSQTQFASPAPVLPAGVRVAVDTANLFTGQRFWEVSLQFSAPVYRSAALVAGIEEVLASRIPKGSALLLELAALLERVEVEDEQAQAAKAQAEIEQTEASVGGGVYCDTCDDEGSILLNEAQLDGTPERRGPCPDCEGGWR